MDDSSVSEMKRRFNNVLIELLASKGHNSQVFSRNFYLEMIHKVKDSKKKLRNKKPGDYHRLKIYDVMIVKGEERLIEPGKDGKPFRFYTYTDEIFDILHEAHIAIGHGGRNRMEKELKPKYKNITRELICTYLNLCKTCQKKHNTFRDGPVGEPQFKEMNIRCQVDLIDMGTRADEENKYILVYQEHNTKFVILKPLKSNSSKEVAYVLLDIFATFGAPGVLQSDLGRDFAYSVVKEVGKMWPDLKMVHGKPDPDEREEVPARQDVENMICSWMEDNNSSKWSEGLRFVQMIKNSAHHAALNCTPYEALFGTKMKIGLKDSVPEETLDAINSEEDLDSYMTCIEDVKCEMIQDD